MAPKTKAPVTPTKQATKAVATLPNNDLMALAAADSAAGMEGTDRESFAIPFIRVLQALSPQCTPGKTGYLKAARPSMIFNTVTGALIDGEQGIIFLPCAYQRRFIQWGARSAGAGFKGEHLPEDIAAKLITGELVKSEDDGQIYFAGKTNPKKDDYFADTRSHFGLVLTEAGPVQALISLSGSQVKKSKQLMGILSAVRLNGKTPPTWMNRIHITTIAESNDQGSWFGVRVEHAGFIEDRATYEAGKAFYGIIGAGNAHADFRDSADAEGKGF